MDLDLDLLHRFRCDCSRRLRLRGATGCGNAGQQMMVAMEHPPPFSLKPQSGAEYRPDQLVDRTTHWWTGLRQYHKVQSRHLANKAHPSLVSTLYSEALG